MFSLPNYLPLSFIWWRIVTMIMCLSGSSLSDKKSWGRKAVYGGVSRQLVWLHLRLFVVKSANARILRDLGTSLNIKIIFVVKSANARILRDLGTSLNIKIIFVVKSANPTQSNARILRALIRIIFARLEGRTEVYGGGSHQLVWLHCLQMNLSPQQHCSEMLYNSAL